MAKVKYYAKENIKLGTHSFYAVPVPNGTLTFNEVCEEACRNTSIEPSIMKAAVAEYMKTVQSNVLKGFRVPVGDQFLTVYPNLNASVKDVKDKEGKVTVATAKMLTANKGKSRLDASVSIKFSQEFASNVSWQKIDERTGAEIPDEERHYRWRRRQPCRWWWRRAGALIHQRLLKGNRKESIRILPDFS